MQVAKRDLKQDDPHQAATWGNRCHAQYRRGELDAALADCEQALKLDAHQSEGWGRRGQVRMGKGGLTGALADFDRALVLDPKRADFYSQRGKTTKAPGTVDARGSLDSKQTSRILRAASRGAES